MAAKLHQCPACRQPLVALELHGVEIDSCFECGGTWLDPGELEAITRLAGAPPDALTRALREARPSAPSAKPSGESARARASAGAPRLCPRCAKPLQEILVGAAPPRYPGVRLDRCPRGHGLWFDRGEMKTLIEEYDSGQTGAVALFFAEMFKADLESAPPRSNPTTSLSPSSNPIRKES